MAASNLSTTIVRKLKNILNKQQNLTTSCGSVMVTRWDISDVTHNKNEKSNYAVLVLNRPVTQNHDFLMRFWNNATVRILVDGGAVRWNSFITQLHEGVQKTVKDPDLLTGDFDSISEEILEKYTKQGCKIVETPDQNYTDFTKALMELNKHCQENKIKIDHVVALAQTSGRVDQILGNIQTLCLAKERNLMSRCQKIFLMSDDSLSWLLSPGQHVLNIPEVVMNGRTVWCSLVPMGESCKSVTTKGLKWDLDNSELKFGHLVSTSNAFSGSEEVEIKCSHTILWSMRVPSLISH